MVIPAASVISGQQACSETMSDFWEHERAFARYLEDVRTDPETKRKELEERVYRWMASIDSISE